MSPRHQLTTVVFVGEVVTVVIAVTYFRPGDTLCVVTLELGVGTVLCKTELDVSVDDNYGKLPTSNLIFELRHGFI